MGVVSGWSQREASISSELTKYSYSLISDTTKVGAVSHLIGAVFQLVGVVCSKGSEEESDNAQRAPDDDETGTSPRWYCRDWSPPNCSTRRKRRSRRRSLWSWCRCLHLPLLRYRTMK